ncbi:LysM peptidoglycan-binding domain-containing protein [Rhodococcus pyridinivorans]|uniref:LysM peptidoglycan-binding domain-containing protein n=1 Tax=Rhodococcus pyridinivorans TaxID=103816 RepID=UPI000BA24A6C|nr:LysM peptidoglycan-binding domain-containing protein [Rhodococcus pyridinivorans]
MVTKYEVVAGDTLSKLAQRFYGDATLFPVIAVPNGITDPDEITVGQELLIPYITERHTVAPDETLSGLVQHFYGDGTLFPVLAAANRIADPNVIQVGRVLIRPGLNYRHTVVPGDTLRALAEDHYGNAEMFAMIAAANHIADPNRITVGQVLFFPNLTNF